MNGQADLFGGAPAAGQDGTGHLASEPARCHYCGRVVDRGARGNRYLGDGRWAHGDCVTQRERDARDDVLTILERTTSEWLDILRERLKGQYLATGLPVSADDAQAHLDEVPGFPSREEMPRKFLGALFRVDGWRPHGWTESNTPGARARALRTWVWKPGKDGDG